jgi:hypothetical protein
MSSAVPTSTQIRPFSVDIPDLPHEAPAAFADAVFEVGGAT